MKTVAICGSMRFEAEMRAAALDLELHHEMNVLQCVYPVPGVNLSIGNLLVLGAAHYRKIDLADAIYVMDVGGYIGESVQKEIEYAKSIGKDVIYDSEFRGETLGDPFF